MEVAHTYVFLRYYNISTMVDSFNINFVPRPKKDPFFWDD